jgi:16S rRNA processing protein RimM
MMKRSSRRTENTEHHAGSPKPGGPAFLAVGYLRKPHGLHGEMLMDILTDYPERLVVGRELTAGSDHEVLVIESVRGHSKGLLVKFKGINSPEEAGRLRNTELSIHSADVPELPEGEYYHHQLIGIHVVDVSGKPLGVITEILETGANDVYLIVSESGDELLVPVISGITVSVDLDARQMVINPPVWD